MFEAMGMTAEMAHTLTTSWAQATQCQYTLVLKRWTDHCWAMGINAQRPTLEQGIRYLLKPFSKGAAGNSIHTVQSLVSTFVTYGGCPCGEHPLFTRLLKGIHNLKSMVPKLSCAWDPCILLKAL